MKIYLALALLFLFNVGRSQIRDSLFTRGHLVVRDRILVTMDPASPSTMPANTSVIKAVRDGRTATLNDCGVKASFTPGGDSISPRNLNVNFTSTSTNATSIQWIVDGFGSGNTQPTLNWWFTSVGLHDIKLVASNGSCTDTAVAYYLITGDTPPWGHDALLSQYGFQTADDYGTALTTLKDGSYLLGGYSNLYNSQEGDRGLLVKVKPGGCVEWTRIFQGESSRIWSVRALKDSGLLVSVSGVNAGIYRMDRNGNLLWKYCYRTAAMALAFRTLYELSDGSIIAGSGDNSFDGFYLLKLSATGQLLWNKFYMKEDDDFATPTGVAEIGPDIFISGFVDNPNKEAAYNSEYNKDGFIISINAATGTTNWSKLYGAVGFDDFFQDIHNYGPNLLVNDIRTNYLGGANASQAFHFISPDGRILKSSRVINTPVLGVPFYTGIVPLSDGRLYLFQSGYEAIQLQPGFVMHSNWQKIDTSNKIYWQKIFSDYPRGYFQAIDTGKNEKLVTVGNDANMLERYSYNTRNMLLAQIDSSGIKDDLFCTFYKATNTIVPDVIQSTPLVWLKDMSLPYQVTPAPRAPNIAYSEMRYSCPDFIDSCTYVKLNGRQKICDLSATYQYRVSRSHSCFQPVTWDLPLGVEVITKNDSLVEIRFQAFGTYKIGALLNNECNPMKDSIYVITQSSSASLKLRNDTAICAGTSLVLKAGPKFIRYRWQDNATDSNYVVSTPGLYWVSVTDSCGNIQRDSVLITLSDKIPIDLGADRSVCSGDTLHLNAPSGFLNYSWSNNYKISSVTSQNVIVSPTVDTAYYIRAEKTPGCFAYDTIRVHVNSALPINLGADQSFCSGDSAVFDAGAGFVQYNWSNGWTSRRIVVKTAGNYSVKAVTGQGCFSFDTVRVVNVFANPLVSLDPHTFLCAGDSRTLDAGNYVAYQWNNGSTSRQISINDLGSYSVQVTDGNGCKGRDTAIITAILSLPSGFLPADTLLCSYDKLTIASLHSYNSYQWSTGEWTPSVTITRPGNYWLQVKDNNDCTGRDSIIINPKDCMKGIYVPTAFSPNHDGKNDVFRPLLFGNVKTYQLTVFNRWGQAVFQTTERNRGWDGNISGVLQDPNVFVWICTYQFEGEASHTERGTVVLTR